MHAIMFRVRFLVNVRLFINKLYYITILYVFMLIISNIFVIFFKLISKALLINPSTHGTARTPPVLFWCFLKNLQATHTWKNVFIAYAPMKEKIPNI